METMILDFLSGGEEKEELRKNPACNREIIVSIVSTVSLKLRAAKFGNSIAEQTRGDHA